MSYGAGNGREARHPRSSREQLGRGREERGQAQTAPEEQETAQHERRAEKAAFLRDKLEELAESERKAGDGRRNS